MSIGDNDGSIVVTPYSSTNFSSRLAVKEVTIKRECTHYVDGAVAVARYISDEIKRNVISLEAQRIRYHVSGEIGDKMQKVFDDIDASIAKVGKESGRTVYGYSRRPNFTTALGLWSGMVNTNKPWDHKLKIRERFKSIAVSRPLKSGTWSKTYYHKYKDYDYFLDIWSNIHYGYVGLSVGFSEDMLIDGSDTQQFFHNLKNFNFGNDTIDDKTAINIGFKLFYQFGKNARNLQHQNILDMIDSTPMHELKESKSKHWCYDSNNPNRVEKRK